MIKNCEKLAITVSFTTFEMYLTMLHTVIAFSINKKNYFSYNISITACVKNNYIIQNFCI